MSARRETVAQETTPASGPKSFDPSTAKVLIGGHELEPSSGADVTHESPKKLSAFDEATKLRAALLKINKREREAALNAAERYRAERRELLAGASDKAVAILEAAAEDGALE